VHLSVRTSDEDRLAAFARGLGALEVEIDALDDIVRTDPQLEGTHPGTGR
jgi:hypothetical protein